MSDKEKLVQWMMQRGYATGHGDTMEDLLRELAWQMDERIERAVEKEREEIAKEAERNGNSILAMQLRARGEKNE